MKDTQAWWAVWLIKWRGEAMRRRTHPLHNLTKHDLPSCWQEGPGRPDWTPVRKRLLNRSKYFPRGNAPYLSESSRRFQKQSQETCNPHHLHEFPSPEQRHFMTWDDNNTTFILLYPLLNYIWTNIITQLLYWFVLTKTLARHLNDGEPETAIKTVMTQLLYCSILFLSFIWHQINDYCQLKLHTLIPFSKICCKYGAVHKWRHHPRGRGGKPKDDEWWQMMTCWRG